MSMIEGVGDEVVWCVLILVILLLVSFAWLSTGVRPLWNGNSVWLVQMQTWPNRRVLQVMQIDEAAANQLEGDTTTRTVRLNAANISNTSGVSTELVTVENTESGENEELTDSSSADTDVDTPPDSPVVQESREDTASTSAGASETTIRLKFLDDTQRLVGAWLSQTVGDFKSRHFNTEVHSGKVIRLIYQGQLLRDDTRSLGSYGLHDNCILHCHVSNTPYSQPGNASSSPSNTPATPGGSRLELGNYIYLIFALKFVLLWSVFCVYPQYFDFSSMFMLVICTAVYVTFLYTSHRGAVTVT